jgi:hypothetical protein
MRINFRQILNQILLNAADILVITAAPPWKAVERNGYYRMLINVFLIKRRI